MAKDVIQHISEEDNATALRPYVESNFDLFS